MDAIGLDQGVDLALNALFANRLAFLCGAGLSMAPPSRLPSAAALAAEAKRRYDARFAGIRPELPEGIEEQAEFFLERGELNTVYLRSLIDRNVFATPPNDGHTAIADLLLVNAADIVLSTNVDTLIETAGTLLHGQIGYGFELKSLAALSPGVAPLVKLHGCWATNPDSTIWAHGQFLIEPFATRIAELSTWISARLQDRDLVIIGFWTDWPYLNGMLEATLGSVRPSRVLVVDLSDGQYLTEKAPSLSALGDRAGVAFFHLRASGAVFLEELRRQFSRSYIRQVLSNGSIVYPALHQEPCDPAWLSIPNEADSNDLWQMRRDLEGRRPNEPSTETVPDDQPLLGETILLLRKRGAVLTGSFWSLGGRTIRVIKASLQPLNLVESTFLYDTAPAASADAVVAIGSVATHLPPDIVRGATTPTIARGAAGRWMTREEALEEFELL
jgi:hypothetical protein